MKNSFSGAATETLDKSQMLSEERAAEIISASFEGCENIVTFDHLPAERKARLDAADDFVLLLAKALVNYCNKRSPNAFKNDVSLLDLPSVRFGTFSNIPFLRITVGSSNSMQTANHVPVLLEIQGHVQCRSFEAFTHRFDIAVNLKKRIVCIKNNPKKPKPIEIAPTAPERDETIPEIQKINKPRIAPNAPRNNEEFIRIIRAIYTTYPSSCEKLVRALSGVPDIRSHFEKNGNLESFLEIDDIGEKTVALLEDLCVKGVTGGLSEDIRDEVLMVLRSGEKFPRRMMF